MATRPTRGGAPAPAPAGGGASAPNPAPAGNQQQQNPGHGGTPSKPEVKMYVTGCRTNLRVRVTYHNNNGAGQTHDFPLCFGPAADPCGFSIPGNNTVSVQLGNGIRNNINLSAFPLYTKVGIITPKGEEMSMDIPNDPPVLTNAVANVLDKVVLGTPQMLTPEKACPRQYRVTIRAISPTGKGVGNHQLEWSFAAQHGILTTNNTPAQKGSSEVVVSVNHDNMNPDKTPLSLEVRSMSYGDKVATIPLPPPPKPEPKSPIARFMQGLQGGNQERH